jgi:serine/threonine protein kinase/formylglycine-generating enzyme required for sulfatase activity
MDDAENSSSRENLQAAGEESEESFSLLCPTKLGRYVLLRRLGKGGFGEVFLAFDEDLERPVAIKVPHRERITQPEDLEAFLNEARILANLHHPHIVPVHDVGRTDNGLCFVVSKFIEGSDLATRIKQNRPAHHESAGLIATVAEALHFAHTRGLVHRDVKPANILIDASGNPFLADFGLALKEEDFGRAGGIVGTPSYMSPEQARGEGHRVDGRSDIFSLGVVVYELLTGRRPFRGDSNLELMEQITSTEPRPPRQVDDTIPKELERICLKALSKRASERYTTARDMAEDLRIFIQTVVGAPSPVVAPGVVSPASGSIQEATPQPTTPIASDSDQLHIKVVPKGLRSFDQHDADFFLELLPGPRDRDGLPDTIRFWKDRIEETDSDQTFQVGLIYGPSGCGKSSLVRAGLLPRLAKHVLQVYIEATEDETETRLLKGLRKVCVDLSPRMGLLDSLMAIRQGRVLRPSQKVLVVLDQFEQWLHAKRGGENTELVNALRQCDGEHVQAVVLLRDDFWMAATRFMAHLEVDLVQGRNTARVDLFEPRHARNVLSAFGTAYGSLPDRSAEISRDQHAFLDKAISELAQDGKIVSVRLALFAEIVKGKPWTLATLREVGGMEGVGVKFLEETFSSAHANPKHRLHQKSAQAILQALLPATGTDIKGQMRSEGELQETANYTVLPREFADLIHILDNELHLITPIDPESSGDERRADLQGKRYYQLTHDYLVHSLRDWLTQKQRETRRGRAELLLVERSALWKARPENRYLPSERELATIGLLTARVKWTESQRRMMRRAATVHGTRLIGTSAVLFLLLAGVFAYGVYSLAQPLANSLSTADVEKIPTILNQLAAYPQWTYESRLHASVQSKVLVDLLLDADPKSFTTLLQAIPKNDPIVISELRSAVTLRASSSRSGEPAADAESPSVTDTPLKVRETSDDRTSARAASAAVTLIRLGDATGVWHLLEHSPDPGCRSAMITALSAFDVSPAVLVDEFGRLLKGAESAKRELPKIDAKNAYLFDPDLSKRRALIMALAEYRPESLGQPKRDALVATFIELFHNDPDAGVHSATELLLTRWGVQDQLHIAGGPWDSKNQGERRWYVNPLGQTMVLIDGPVEFSMGSPPNQPERSDEEIYRRRVIPRRFFIASKEFTVEQFQRYVTATGQNRHAQTDEKWDPRAPQVRLSWFECAAICNWLGDQEHLPHCYLANEDGKFAAGMRIDAKAMAAGGYRMHTEAEWEYACRAGTVTSRYYGNSEDLLAHYEWFGRYREKRAHPCGMLLPNDFGLFDMLGNVMEWCHDLHQEHESIVVKKDDDLSHDEKVTNEVRHVRSDKYSQNPVPLRSASRGWFNPRDNSRSDLGFRPARTLP